MIDPDYIPVRIPYASPLPSRTTGTVPCGDSPRPRLPGKPVQNMPPSPQRQGRRGYDSWPTVKWQNMVVPTLVSGACFTVSMICLTAITWGMGVFLSPIVAPFFSAWGVHWSGNMGRVTTTQARRSALLMTSIFGAIPLALLASQLISSMWLPFSVLYILTVIGAVIGAVIASLETWKPRNQPCVEA